MSEAAAVYGTSQAIPVCVCVGMWCVCVWCVVCMCLGVCLTCPCRLQDRSIIEDIVKGYISITYQLPADPDSDTKADKKKDKKKN